MKAFWLGMRGHLWTVVQPDGLGLAVDFHEFLHDPYQPQGRDGAATFDAQPLPVVFINDVERAKWPTFVERIAHDRSLARWAKVQYGTWKDAASALGCNEKTLRDDAK